MKTTRRRRILASFSGLALAASSLVLGASIAEAQSTTLECFGADPGTQSLLDIIAPPEAERPVSLEVDVDGGLAAPAVVDTGAQFTATVAPSVDLPDDLVATLGDMGVQQATVSDMITTVSLTNASPATITSPAYGVTIPVPASGGLAVNQPAFSANVEATGPDQSHITYAFQSIDFGVSVQLPGLGDVTLFLTCIPANGGVIGTTEILQPGPPIAPDLEIDVPLGGARTSNLGVTGNPVPHTVELIDTPALGSASIAKVGGSWRFTYEHDESAGAGSEVLTYRAISDHSEGITVGTITVNVLDNMCAVGSSGQCSLSQIIELDVQGDVLSMQQDAANVELDAITLDGSPQSTTGELNPVTVKDARGDGAGWSLTGMVSDFKTDPTVGNCPAGDSSSWDYRCIPANNLGWSPAAVVAHEQIPGDVAAVDAGSASDIDDIRAGVAGSGLATQQSLCSGEPTTSGGTFACGAGLALLVPASASAGTYAATLTLTLA